MVISRGCVKQQDASVFVCYKLSVSRATVICTKYGTQMAICAIGVCPRERSPSGEVYVAVCRGCRGRRVSRHNAGIDSWDTCLENIYQVPDAVMALRKCCGSETYSSPSRGPRRMRETPRICQAGCVQCPETLSCFGDLAGPLTRPSFLHLFIKHAPASPRT